VDALTIDVRTAMLLAACLTALIGATLALTYRGFPSPMRESLAAWSRGTALMPIGWLLYALRDVVPEVWTTLVPSAALALGYALIAVAVRLFFGRPPLLVPLLALVAALLGAEAAVTLVWPTYTGRFLVTFVGAALLQLVAAWPLLRSERKSRPSSHWLTAGVFLAGAVVFVLRIGAELLTDTPTRSLFEQSPIQSLVFAYVVAGPVVTSVGFVMMCNDRFNRDLSRMASIDALTGAYNRRTLEQLADRLIARALRDQRTVAVLMCDIDHFKRINDAYGHEAGDIALQALVERLRNSVRAEDLLGRYGGEEFVVVMPDSDETTAVAVAERIRTAVSASRIDIGDALIGMTVSIGVAAWQPDEADFGTLVRRADQAMYAAKRGGRNRVIAASQLGESGATRARAPSRNA
jgi:diguanylate cyclase (GGDEF)-like protein